MIGLVILIAGVIYLGLLIWATRVAYRWAKNKGLPKSKCWAAAAGGFAAVYLPVFWDHIPTVLTKQYLCTTQAGFQTYKTVEQWKKENPGVMETLSPPPQSGVRIVSESFNGGRGRADLYSLNERFRWIVTLQDFSFVLPIIQREEKIVDSGKNEVLARYIDFSTGNSVKDTIGPPGPLKAWLHSERCPGGGEQQDALRNVRNEFAGRKK